uniref:Uncharacterized protein n=1 Tax=Timema poppense TaxID=170557 RepID=A0A7R9HIK5_TIMPO|nr:unnamed protein product [Timema poppensis]
MNIMVQSTDWASVRVGEREIERKREREGLMSGWLKDYSYKCQPIDYSDNPIALRVFFVLRKKNNHDIVPPSVPSHLDACLQLGWSEVPPRYCMVLPRVW